MHMNDMIYDMTLIFNYLFTSYHIYGMQCKAIIA